MGQIVQPGQQAPKGFRQKSKKELAEEQLEVYKAQQEEARQKAMTNWYGSAERYVLDLFVSLGFPAHTSKPEKIEKIVGALTHLAANIIAGDDDNNDPVAFGKGFGDQIRTTIEKNIEERARIRTEKMASLVAALIHDPSLNTGGLEKALEEPWLGIAQKNKAATQETRESDAFGLLAGVKLHDNPAALYLRTQLTEAKDYTTAALKLGWDRIFPELVAEKLKANAAAAKEEAAS